MFGIISFISFVPIPDEKCITRISFCQGLFFTDEISAIIISMIEHIIFGSQNNSGLYIVEGWLGGILWSIWARQGQGSTITFQAYSDMV